MGCQLNGNQQFAAQPFGNVPHQAIPGYEQTFPPQVAGPAVGPVNNYGPRIGQFMGTLASGFFRSAVGGAGFTAGNDLWNAIIN